MSNEIARVRFLMNPYEKMSSFILILIDTPFRQCYILFPSNLSRDFSFKIKRRTYSWLH